MTTSTLNEIDRLEGIAQAFAHRRPIVPMTGVLEDCDLARRTVERIGDIDTDIARGLVRLAELQYDIDDIRGDLDDDKVDLASTQADLDKLMASLSARLER